MEAEPLGPTLDYIRSKTGQKQEGAAVPWGRQIAGLQSLQVLEIEFETESKKKSQLDVVIDRAKRWRFPRQDGSHLRWDGEISEMKWQCLEHPVTDRDEDSGEEGHDDEEVNDEDADSDADADQDNMSHTTTQGEAPVAEDQAIPPMLTYVVTVLTFRPVKSRPLPPTRDDEGVH